MVVKAAVAASDVVQDQFTFGQSLPAHSRCDVAFYMLHKNPWPPAAPKRLQVGNRRVIVAADDPFAVELARGRGRSPGADR